MISLPQPCIGQKLRAPALPPSFVSRPRLSALLDAALCNRIALMHAPAGFGKTTAAASWARTTRTPNTWLCLDELDRDPSVLAANIVQAIRNLLAPNEGEFLPAEGTWESPQRFVAETCSALERLGANGQAGNPCVLVLDNCHVIEGVPRPEPDSDGPSGSLGRNASAPNRISPTPTGEARALLALMVGHVPPWLHVLLISRTEAIGDAASLALQGERTEIGIDELRATKLESDAFWRKVPEAAGSEDALFAYTNGWFAAMKLIAAGWANAVPDARPATDAPSPANPRKEDGSGKHMPSQRNSPEKTCVDVLPLHAEKALSLPASSVSRLQGYFEREILSPLSAEAQEAYCAASRIGPFDIDMISHIADKPFADAARAVRELRGCGLLRLEGSDRGNEWFSCSGQFADLCPLSPSDPRIGTWLERAYACYEEKGLHELSLQTALANADWPHIERTLWMRFMPLVENSDFELLQNWLGRIPKDRVRAKSRVALMSMMAAARRRDFSEMNEDIDLVTSTLDESRHDHYYGLAKTICATTRAVSADRKEARQLVSEAYGLLDDGDVFLKGLAKQIVAESYMEEDIVVMSDQLNDLFWKKNWRADKNFGGSLLSSITLVNAMLGKFNAQEQLDQTFERHGANTDAESPLWMRFHLGKAAQSYQKGNLDDAQNHLSFCEKGVRSSGIEIDLGFFYALKAMLALALDAAAAASAKSLLLQGVAESALFAAFAFPSLELIDAAFPTGARLPQSLYREKDGNQPALMRLRAAAELSAQGTVSCIPDCHSYALSIPENRPFERFSWLLFASLEENGRNNLLSADELMAQAIGIAETEGYVQPFVSDGAAVMPIFKRVARKESPFQKALLKAMPARSRRRAAPIRLTPREAEVAALLDSDLSFAEMAERLFVSPETLRKHVKHIYSKLDAHSRQQAVAYLKKSNALRPSP